MKIKKFIRRLEEGKFNVANIVMREGLSTYFSKVALVYYYQYTRYNGEVENTFYGIDIELPVFMKKIMGMSIVGMSDESVVEEITKFFHSMGKECFVVEDYFYYETMRINELIRTNTYEFNKLSDEDKQIALKLEEMDKLVLGKTKNQFGETIITDYISGSIESGFTREYVNCYSSSWLGFGICRCHYHPIYKEEELSLSDAIEIAKEKMVELA